MRPQKRKFRLSGAGLAIAGTGLVTIFVVRIVLVSQHVTERRIHNLLTILGGVFLVVGIIVGARQNRT